MEKLILVGVLALGAGLLLRWGFRRLPGERWQFLAAVPVAKNGDGGWHGVNFTFYGLFTALALMAAAATLVFLLGTVGVEPLTILAFTLPLLSAAIPAARLVARWVEHKPATLTIAGAWFVGLLLAPWLAKAASLALDRPLPVTPCLAALSVAYALGEGLGRLACLSFGCCYGRPLDESPAWARFLVGGRSLRFLGATKKIAYESGLEGRPVLPVQAMSAVVGVTAGLVGLYLFLEAWFTAALLVALVATSVWRLVAETLRADFRGRHRFTAYQAMSLAGLVYASLLSLWFAENAPRPVLAQGFATLWTPGVLLSLQGLGLFILYFSGRSRVTGAHLSFHVVQDQI
ncbi:MAG: prolipoprotein diacylglyceryl transferase [Deltaproteobacteria bacterium]|nr:prolipoprotein diacylglyceryl transferase [Deltaproteobacteria bacterium]